MIKTYRRVLGYVFRYKKHLIGAIFFMLLFVVFSVFSIGVIMPFINVLFKANTSEAVPVESPATRPDRQLEKSTGNEKLDRVMVSIPDLRSYIELKFHELVNRYSRPTTLKILCLVLLLGFFGKNLAAILQTFFISVVEQGVMRDLRQDLYDHFHRLSLRFFHGERTGQLISRITNDVTVINASITAAINSLFRDPPLVIFYFIFLILLSWRLTLVIVLILPIAGYLTAMLGNRLKKDSLYMQERMADLTAIIQETLYGIRVIKAFNTAQKEIARFARENQNYFRTLVRMTRVRKMGPSLNEFIGAIAGVVVLYVGGIEVLGEKSSLSPGGFVLYLVALFSMFQPLKLLGQVHNSLKEGMVAAERVFQVLDTPADVVDKPEAISVTQLKESIAFHEVWFSYDGKMDVLRNIDLKVKKGEIIALVGPSGGGKSTLVDLIARFYDPSRGRVEIDGQDLRNIAADSFRNLIGIVTQETILFYDTVRNNIAYGSAWASENEIVAAARAANADDFIQAMPEGYQTIIGDRGVKLSGGQRQRLAIARAILKNPPILIFDEATSALDTESELLVQQAIERLFEGRTTFVIAHRLSTVRNADRIVVIDRGRILQIGNHQQLMLAGGLYKTLYEMQFRSNGTGES